MRYVRRAAVVLVVLAVGAFTQLPSAALENDDPSVLPPTPYVNGPDGPLVFVIGDSISADPQQRDIYAWINGGLGWKTQIEAVGGSNIVEHFRFGSFDQARNSNAEAVYVELGTNDIGGINDAMTPSQALIEIAKVFTAIDNAVNALGNKCIVWEGLNEQWDAPFGPLIYNDKDVAAAINAHLKSLLASHPNLHYADYDLYVQQNETFRNSLQADIVKIHPQGADGKIALANFEALWTAFYCSP